jgi:His/Glu/Gln/Arg/opine family amino acid ABC transporter permease subunit
VRDFGLNFAAVRSAGPQIVDATGVALSVAAVSMTLAFAIGLFAALVSTHLGKGADRAVSVYVESMRNSPSLVKLYFIFFGLPGIGIFPSAFWSGVLALGIHNGSYMTETIKGALASVPNTQVQAARALGMSWWQVQHIVVFPQALRTGIPALTNTWVEMIKDTSLTSAVAVQELTYLMTALISMTLRSVEMLTVFSTIYLALTLGFTLVSKLVERRLVH